MNGAIERTINFMFGMVVQGKTSSFYTHRVSNCETTVCQVNLQIVHVSTWWILFAVTSCASKCTYAHN